MNFGHPSRIQGAGYRAQGSGCDSPEGRQTHSLGRQPQGTMSSQRIRPGGATDFGCSVRCSRSPPSVCRRFAAFRFFFGLNLGLLTACGRRVAHSPGCGRCRTRCRDSRSTRSPAERGLTPQAMYLSPLRGSPQTRPPCTHRHHQSIQMIVTTICQDPAKRVANSKFEIRNSNSLRVAYLFFP